MLVGADGCPGGCEKSRVCRNETKRGTNKREVGQVRTADSGKEANRQKMKVEKDKTVGREGEKVLNVKTGAT